MPAISAVSNATPEHAIRRILLATDMTTASAGATDQALELAHDLHASLLAVSVIDVEDGARSGRRLPRMDQRRAAREDAAQALVLRGRRQGVGVSFLVWEGEPGPAIVEAAVSEEADLVVVGTHGRGSLGRLLIGSVSEYVVRNAPCPVLVVRPGPAS
jgi:nucleotide-binding universal stress UspA family protein